MNRYGAQILFSLLTLSLFSQTKPLGDFIESTSQNDRSRSKERALQYRPDGDDFVSVNGKNRFTRALYGGHTAFRIETSDRPVFAVFDKSKSKNIRLRLISNSDNIALDSVDYCESRYTAGRRSYRLTDKRWGKGKLNISVLAYTEKEGAVWKITAAGMPKGAKLLCQISEIRAKRLNRSGDMGADPSDCFEAPVTPQSLNEISFLLSSENYITLTDYTLSQLAVQQGKSAYEKAEKARSQLASRIKIETPDPYFNTLGGALSVAADGIWDGKVWLHGAVGWRMPLNGWRAAYAGDLLGWHDRARTHFDAYASSQVTQVPNIIHHPTQDTLANLARSVKKWGTPQYSNGYICRNPERNDQMHHYDMNLCYIDELLWHFNWTGDLNYVRKMWPVLTRHLAWEKLNYDPDNDGLYDAYACIWASDALYYNSGAVTHSSAYNYRANRLAASLAEKIGEDPTQYRNEANKIMRAMNQRLWLKERGSWAEYQDFMGKKRVHPSAGVWTVYHAMESELPDPFQAYQSTRYIDTEIPHIPVRGVGLKDDHYSTISSTNWLPYSWSINNVAFGEVMHTALAYFQARRADEGYQLLKSSILDGMYLGDSPGNFGQISFYDAARGECYRDFGDPIGVASRALLQGLFGILPDAIEGKLKLQPNFPSQWDKARVVTPDISFAYSSKKKVDHYHIEQRFANLLAINLQVNARRDSIDVLTINGTKAKWRFVESASGNPVIAIDAPAERMIDIEICWSDRLLQHCVAPSNAFFIGDSYVLKAPSGTNFRRIYDPQTVLSNAVMNQQSLSGVVKGISGWRTLFVQISQGQMLWWQPVSVRIEEKQIAVDTHFSHVNLSTCEPIDLGAIYNASVTDIFKNEYLSPRSPYTTLQIPKQGIGEWCHPQLGAEIDDSGIRRLSHDGLIKLVSDVPFKTPKVGKNVVFTSLWDNYPDSLSVQLSGKASHAYLWLAGSTNHMQCHIPNGIVVVYYTDGTSDRLELVNPDNWCPIEQDFYEDEGAFQVKKPRPYRVQLKTGLVSDNLGKVLNIKGVYGREIEGGAALLLDMPLNMEKTITHLTLETLSNDVVIGLMGVTLQR